MRQPLVVLGTHAIQYHAPVYRLLQKNYQIPTIAIYGSDFSIDGYRDAEFQTSFAWDTDLLSGYTAKFLTHVAATGQQLPEELSGAGIDLLLEQIKPATILITGYQMKFHQQAFWQAWRSGVPLLFRAETTDHALQRSFLKSCLRDAALRWYYQRFAALLYIGQHSLSHYRRLASEKCPLFFSPYGIDTTPFQTDETAHRHLRKQMREQLNLNQTDQVLLFSGKLVDKKNPELILQAVKSFTLEKRNQVKVLFLGSGPLQARLQQLANEAPCIDVRFLGFQNQKALSPFYHAADLLVLPSQYGETWGLVVNEALHHGLPCVVSDAVGSALDLIVADQTGAIFPSGSVQGLADAIQRSLKLIDEPATRQHCRQQVNNYTTERAAQGIAEAYLHVTSS